jgi:hypothetical protein
MVGDFVIGSPVSIWPKDDFYEFVSGWNGRVIGFVSGHVSVLCKNPDGQDVTLQVPADQLRHKKIVGAV